MTITITKDSDPIKISVFDEEAALHLTAETVRDIARALAEEASEQAPLGKTGALKAHPVDVNEVTRYVPHHVGNNLPFGSVVEPFPSFGGGFTVRGAGGRFVKGGSQLEPGTRGRGRSFTGEELELIEVTLPEEPRHAVWVHEGTGIYGPEHEVIRPHPPNKIMVWENEDGNTIKAKFVRGQKPNPYLENAFVIINRTYIPARVEELRLEIKVL